MKMFVELHLEETEHGRSNVRWEVARANLVKVGQPQAFAHIRMLPVYCCTSAKVH